jgi:hypothetical protein
MSLQIIFWAQLIGITGIGGFVGEYLRAAQTGNEINRLFWANFFAGSFLSVLIGWSFFHLTEQKVWSFILAGFVSYQDEKQAVKFLRGFLNYALKGGEKDDDSTS